MRDEMMKQMEEDPNFDEMHDREPATAAAGSDRHKEAEQQSVIAAAAAASGKAAAADAAAAAAGGAVGPDGFQLDPVVAGLDLESQGQKIHGAQRASR
jgi:hypothetical protein